MFICRLQMMNIGKVPKAQSAVALTIPSAYVIPSVGALAMHFSDAG